MTLHDLKCLGFFGEVFRGIWNGTDVAIKVFLEQDLTPENMENFCNEVSILRYSPPCLCHDQIRTSVVLTSSLFFLWFNISRIRHPNGTWRLTHLYFLYHPLKTSYPSSLHGSHSLPGRVHETAEAVDGHGVHGDGLPLLPHPHHRAEKPQLAAQA